MSSTALGLPRRIEDTIEKLDRGDIRLRVRSIESDRILRRMSSMQLLTNYTILVGTFILSATIFWVNAWPWLAAIALILASFLGVSTFRQWRKINRLDRMP